MSDEDGLGGGEEDEEDTEDQEDRRNVCSIDNVLSDRSPRNEDESGRSVTTIISEKIRSKLPSISERFKGLLRSIGSRQPRQESDATVTEENSDKNLEEFHGTSSNRNSAETSLNVATNSYEEGQREEATIDLSTSSMFSIQDEDSSIYSAGRIVSFADGTSSRINESQRITTMVSNSMNTVEIATNFNLENFLANGAIIAENPMEFAAVLSVPFGVPGLHEPQSVPLDYAQDENQSETYLEDHMNGESSVTESSTIGSEVSSYTEAEESERRDQATGQDNEPPILFYNPRISPQCGSSSGGGSTEGVVVSSNNSSSGGGGGGGGVGGSGVVSSGGGGSGGNIVGSSSSGVSGMDCMPLRPGPFHYLINEQAKSLVALQELQNEVGALLEFRDLVIETFPNLRHKMAATASAGASVMSSSQNSHIPLPLSSPSSRRITEWEPGKVRRRVVPREAVAESSSSSSLPRSRSNSQSGGTKNNCSATVQDSGFSTETSSKDSASTAIAPRPSSPRPGVLDEAEDELWNLLDVIHRKGIRLREEVECLQGRLESVATEDLASTDVLEAVRKVTHLDTTETTATPDDEVEESAGRESQVRALRREKEQLLDKVAELEAETISSRARAQELQTELAALSALKTGLEDRLKAELNDVNSDLLTPGAQRLQPIAPVASTPKSANVGNIKSKSSAFASVSKAHKSRFRTRTIEKNVLLDVVAHTDIEHRDIDVEASVNERRARLGALDSVLVSPTRVTHVKDVDSGKIAAILRESSPLELQRHLITTTVHNQVLQKRLDEVQKSTETLSERLDKAREENDDLRFQLEERNIELEGTRARVRVLERLQQRAPTETEPDAESEQPRCEQSGLEPGSSTESARDHHQAVEVKPSPRRRPSRIPLPGSTGKPTAPRPPSHGRNDSRESLKSLTRPPRDSSRDSHCGKSLSKARDTSRESLSNNNNNNNKSMSKSTSSSNNGKETSRDSLNRSLPRNNSSRDSLNKSSSLSRARDSLESSNLGTTPSPGTTPPRRPPAPARRSHSLARAATSVDTDNGKTRTEPPSSWCSTNSSFRHSDSSLYPDSLNQETSSVTGSTRVEFILGSSTRCFRPSSTWPHRFFDSIDSADMIPESLLTDEFPLRCGEAMAEGDSLECHPLSSEG